MAKKAKSSNKNSKGRQNAKRKLPFFAVGSKKKTKSKSKKPNSGLLFEWPVFFAAILMFGGLAVAMIFAHRLIVANTPITIAYTPPVAEIVEVQKPTTKRIGLDESLPLNVEIARLGINYPVMRVGRLADGTMETPPVYGWEAGWYKYSPTPGELGPSIIVGHVGSKKGPSVFWDLNKTIRGDIIEVKREDGKVAKFKVEDVKQFDQDNFPTNEVYGPINYPGLRLITCGGVYDKNIERYSHNNVVYAKLITEK